MIHQNNAGSQPAIDPACLPFSAIATVADFVDLTSAKQDARLTLPAPTTQVFLIPGQATNRPLRRRWTAEKRLMVCVPDDTPGRGPASFHDVTLKWALREADLVILWSCGFAPHIVQQMEAMLKAAPHSVVVMTDRSQFKEWLAFTDKWKMPETLVQCNLVENSIDAELFERMGVSNWHANQIEPEYLSADEVIFGAPSEKGNVR